MDEKNNILAKRYIILKAISIVVLAIVVIIGITWAGKSASKKDSDSNSTATSSDKHDYISDDGKTIADFTTPVINKSQKELKLQFQTQDIETTSDVEQNVFWFLNKYQKITYNADVTYTIDLSGIHTSDINTDDATKTVTITIPKPQHQIALNFDKFKAEEARSNFFVSLGNEKFTFDEINGLEKTAITKINEELNKTDNIKKSEETGLQQAKDFYQSAIDSVDDSYNVEIKYR